MPLEERTRLNTSSKPALDLPPPFRLITLREVGDAFAHAASVASEAGAGTLVYVGRFDLAEFAVVLEPEEPLETARRALYAGLAALAAASGQSLQVPTCEGAIMTANGRDTSMSKYGEGTTFFACVMPYEGGYSVNIYSTFTKASGAFSAATLGATLARTVTGDSSQFIPRTINDIVNGIKATGATVALTEAYP